MHENANGFCLSIGAMHSVQKLTPSVRRRDGRAWKPILLDANERAMEISSVPRAAAEAPFNGEQRENRQPQERAVPERLADFDRIAGNGRHLPEQVREVSGIVEDAAV